MPWWSSLDDGHLDDDRFDGRPTAALPSRPLRMLLVVELAAAGVPLGVAALADTLERHGVLFDGRPSKVISDALRTEMSRGRVERVGRGRYRFVGAPPTTLRRIERRAASVRRYLDWAVQERARLARSSDAS